MYTVYLECTVKWTLPCSGAGGGPNAHVFSHILGKSVKHMLRCWEQWQKQSLNSLHLLLELFDPAYDCGDPTDQKLFNFGITRQDVRGEEIKKTNQKGQAKHKGGVRQRCPRPAVTARPRPHAQPRAGPLAL